MSIPKNRMPDRVILARNEEIGNPALFSGRKAELEFFLKWCEGVKDRISPSTALLARRKRGKTALMERLYNIVWTWADPQLVPFYFRPAEEKTTVVAFSSIFYSSFLTQYLAFTQGASETAFCDYPLSELLRQLKDDADVSRDIRSMEEFVANAVPNVTWNFARSAPARFAQMKDIKIIQFIDEFQYLNDYFYWDEAMTNRAELCGGYHREAESKVAPQLISGSYVGYLASIIRKMVGRYREEELGPLPRDEAIDMVYNYSAILGVPVTDETAPAIAITGFDDPCYIAAIMRSRCPGKDLTRMESIRRVFDFETAPKRGQIAKMWLEYILEAFEKINDIHAKRIVLYLAAADGPRTRRQIAADLALPLTDSELDIKLRKLVKADILAEPLDSQTYAGLGDPVFEIVFRRVYQAEVEGVEPAQVQADVDKAVASLRASVSFHKGLAGEYRAICHLMTACNAGALPADFADAAPPGWEAFGPFKTFGKRTFHLDQKHKIELDALMEASETDGWDVAVEVKNWDTPIDAAAAAELLRKRGLLLPLLRPRTVFLLFAENGAAPDAARILADSGVAITTPARLRQATANANERGQE